MTQILRKKINVKILILEINFKVINVKFINICIATSELKSFEQRKKKSTEF